jgi:hypothetical protein
VVPALEIVRLTWDVKFAFFWYQTAPQYFTPLHVIADPVVTPTKMRGNRELGMLAVMDFEEIT